MTPGASLDEAVARHHLECRQCNSGMLVLAFGKGGRDGHGGLEGGVRHYLTAFDAEDKSTRFWPEPLAINRLAGGVAG